MQYSSDIVVQTVNLGLLLKDAEGLMEWWSTVERKTHTLTHANTTAIKHYIDGLRCHSIVLSTT